MFQPFASPEGHGTKIMQKTFSMLLAYRDQSAAQFPAYLEIKSTQFWTSPKGRLVFVHDDGTTSNALRNTLRLEMSIVHENIIMVNTQ
jgi:hypothetical protein